MRNFLNRNNKLFYKQPKEFNKYTRKELLRYSLGGMLFIPSIKENLIDKFVNNKFGGASSIILCFEDSINDSDVEQGEANVLNTFKELDNLIQQDILHINDLPLIFLRVKNETQFISITTKMKDSYFKLITGFVFPKFTSKNANRYLTILNNLISQKNEILYGLPILETEEVIYKEKRINELVAIKQIISKNDNIIALMVGSTDFSSLFGLRRPINYSVYDLGVINDCLSDILNVFNRQYEEFVIIGSVWEYFSNEKIEITNEITYENIDVSNKPVINKAVDGLIKETICDINNGFCGKGSIHPTQIKYINATYTVTYEEYMDAKNLISNKFGGVFKSVDGGKMNEPKTHFNWARKILNRAEVFGVLKNNVDKIELVKEGI